MREELKTGERDKHASKAKWGTRNELYRDVREILALRDMIDVQSFVWVIAPGYFQ